MEGMFVFLLYTCIFDKTVLDPQRGARVAHMECFVYTGALRKWDMLYQCPCRLVSCRQ